MVSDGCVDVAPPGPKTVPFQIGPTVVMAGAFLIGLEVGETPIGPTMIMVVAAPVGPTTISPSGLMMITQLQS